MMIGYVKKSKFGRRWIFIFPVLNRHTITIIERFKWIILIQEIFAVSKIYGLWRIAVKTMAYINKIIKSKFCVKFALVQRCTSNPSRHEDIARVFLALGFAKVAKRSHHFTVASQSYPFFVFWNLRALHAWNAVVPFVIITLHRKSLYLRQMI
jgi:hypothetical protein